VNSPRNWRSVSYARGFTLVEIVVTIAILVILLSAGVSLLGGTGPQARRSAVDVLTGMIEQARTTAITTRSSVVLAVAEPAAGGDNRYRVGLFKVTSWPDDSSAPTGMTPLGRWRLLESGVILLDGSAGAGLTNPLNEAAVAAGKASAHIVAFDPRGGVRYPAGSAPLVFRVAEGAYRNGKAIPNRRAGSTTVPETLIRIGRVTARPYRMDG